jgi:hypothetical protein
MKIRCLILGAGMLFLLLAGCGGRDRTYHIEGVVLFDGQPLSGATVVFISEEEGAHPASGMTDAEGNFLLTTYKESDGVLAGRYRVLITRTEAIAAPPVPIRPGDEKSVTEHYRSLKSRQNRKSHVPAVYGSEADTPLRCTVPLDDKLVLELNSRAGK